MVEEQGSGEVLWMRMCHRAEPRRTLARTSDCTSVACARYEPAAADAVVQLPHAGRWHAVLHIREARREASVSTDLTVANYSARRGTVWLFCILPICVLLCSRGCRLRSRGRAAAECLSPA